MFIRFAGRCSRSAFSGRSVGALGLVAPLLLSGCTTGTRVGARLATSPARQNAVTPASLPQGHTVRLELVEGEPIVLSPPLLPSVQVEQVEVREALLRLVLEERLPVHAALSEPPVLLAAAGKGALLDRNFQEVWRWGLLCQPGQSPREYGCLSLLEQGFSMDEYERLQVAVGFALDTVWEGMEVALSDAVSSRVLWAMVLGAATSYLVMLAAPDPIFTKGLALVLTAYMVAYLGVGPFWELVEASRALVAASRGAVSFAELEEAGHRFGRVIGENSARIVILLVTAALGGKQGLAARGSTLPGFGWATWLSSSQLRLPLLALESVRAIQLTASGGLVIGLAPTAMAMAAGNKGGSDHSVYISSNSKGQVQYAGMTNDVARRAVEHLRQRGFRIRELLESLSRDDARSVEQALIEIHGLSKNGGTLLNRINSINRANPRYATMVQRGRELLESIGYKVE